MTDRPLSGRTALITGSAQGIGFDIAKTLAGNGARLVIHGLASAQDLATAAAACRDAGAPDVMTFDADVRDVPALERMIAAAEAAAPIDILVNNAGMQRTAPLAEVTPALWDAIIAVNLSAAFHTMRLVLPRMAARGFGRVVNIASVHGLVASKDKGPYVASKFGLVGLTRTAALEYAATGSRETGGVTVNCICPGFTETTLIEPQIQDRATAIGGDRTAGIASLLADKQPSLRMSQPSEIGILVSWLADKRAHNITGAAIPIDGGWTAQ